MLQKKYKTGTPFFRSSTFEVAKLIFSNPNETHHIRGIEKEVKLSTTAILSAVEELAKYQIVIVEDTPLTKNVRANLNSESYRIYKMIFNLYLIKNHSFIDSLIKGYNSPEAIVIFGSYARGEDIKTSDVDILIITSNEPDERLQRTVASFEKEISRKVSIHTLPNLDKSSKEFKNNVANGITLYGYLKVI